MEEYNKDIDIIRFPSCFQYSEYYNAFCKMFDLYEKREKISTIKDGIVIEIYNKEDGHSIPHVHAKYQGKKISISLIDCKVICGNIPKKNERIAVE